MEEKQERWLSRKSKIAGIDLSNGGWMIALWALSWGFGLLAVLSIGVIKDSFMLFLFLVGLPASLLSIWVALKVFIPNIKFLVAVTMLIAAFSFSVESFVLNNAFFSEFSELTRVLLWVVFGSLPFMFFKDHLPKWLKTALVPLYTFGALFCIPFAVKLTTIMTVSWIAIPFAGVGLLTYAPIFAIACFIQAAIELSKESGNDPLIKRPGVIVSTMLVFLAIAHTGYTRYLLVQIDQSKQDLIAESESRYSLSKDLPRWYKVSQIIRSEPLARFFIGSYDNKFRVSRAGHEFNPFYFLAGLGLEQWSSYERSWTDLARSGVLDRDYEKRFFKGASEWIDTVNTHVQIFPEKNLTYTETQLLLHSKRSWNQEVDMIIHIPSGSVASQLSLWIEGVEQPARFASKSAAKNAYETIVSKRRDPAILEWIDESKLRLRVFPVSTKLPRKVKFGIVSNLKNDSNDSVTVNGFKIFGIDRSKAAHHVVVDLFGNKDDYNDVYFQSTLAEFEEKPVFKSDALHWVAQDDYTNEWNFKLNNLTIRKPSSTPVAETSIDNFHTVAFILNQSRTTEEWKTHISDVISRFEQGDHRFLIIGEEIVEIKDAANLGDTLEKISIPHSNIFPLYTSMNGGPENTLIFAPGDNAPSLFSLRESDLYRSSAEYAKYAKLKYKVVITDSKTSNYFESLASVGLVDFYQLQDRKIISLSALENPVLNGNTDKKGYRNRLSAYNLALEDFRKSGFNADNPTIVAMNKVSEAHIVTPFSTLLVLESEKDYIAYGINNSASELNNSQATDPSLAAKLGVVPEPHEWLLIILCVGVVAYFYRGRWSLGAA